MPPLDLPERNFTIRIHRDHTDAANGAPRVAPRSYRKGIYRPGIIERLLMITIFALVFSCNDKQAKVTPAVEKLDAFIKKEKFGQDASVSYPGISDPSLRVELTGKINQAAEDLKAVAQSSNPKQEQYLQKIRAGLGRFKAKPVYDTENRERICHYFEELMDIVGLQSSEGMLNEFMYGFDPG